MTAISNTFPTDAEDLSAVPRSRPTRPTPPRIAVAALAFLLIMVMVLVGLNFARNTPRWTQTFVENFDSPVALGEFPGPDYEDRWTSYDGLEDTSGVGVYSPDRVLSVHDGVLDMYLHTSDGRPRGAAPVPLVDGHWGGQVYGKFAVRFRSDALPGYGAGWLLWPDSNEWQEGEIDFPEGGLDSTIYANQHCIGDPEEKCLAVDTGVRFSSGWHTATIEWTPDGVAYFLDGDLVGKADESPSTPFHMVLQTATTGELPHADIAGHVLIDSVAISSWSRW